MPSHTDLSRIKSIHPNLDIRQGDFPDLGPGGVDNPTITDGEHVILRCSNCNRKLVDVWITSPEEVVTSTVLAKCGYCGDKSFEKKIKGSFHIGATDESLILDTQFLDINMDSTRTIITSQKVLVTTTKGRFND